MWELNSGNMERYPFFSFSPEPSFVAFLDPNVSPYSQISPPGLGVSGVNVFSPDVPSEPDKIETEKLF